MGYPLDRETPKGAHASSWKGWKIPERKRCRAGEGLPQLRVDAEAVDDEGERGRRSAAHWRPRRERPRREERSLGKRERLH